MSQQKIVVACSCEGTMPLDREAIGRGCADAALRTADHLCRRQVDLFKALIGETGDLTIGCTQEAPLFAELAEAAGYEGRLSFGNIREAAGWSDQAADAAPKMAALLAAAAEPVNAPRLHTHESEGVVLVYGFDDNAVEVGRKLAESLDVTVVVTGQAPIAPPRVTEFPVVRGRVRSATGALGGFELTLDAFARPAPSSRTALVWGESRDGLTSRCDIFVDLTGGPSFFPGRDLREGYIRADASSPVMAERAVRRAAALIGTFDKPRAVDFRADLCAHSRSGKVGCRRCLDLCPTGAISPAGDHVAIDPAICAGCGQCAAACPTGAAGYELPSAETLMRRLRRAILGYAAAGGADALILFHDGDHGAALIDTLGRFGRGLPAYAIPVEVNETTQIGPETSLAAFAWGATGVAFLTRARPKHDPAGLNKVVELTGALAGGLGYGRDVARVIATDDPDGLRAALDEFPPGEAAARPASFMPAGRKRDLLDVTLRELHAAAPARVERIELPEGAPLGGLSIDAGGCTLCLSCVPSCPVGALGDRADRPTLTFDEGLCVQCGLCAATCPEKVIALSPRADFEARRVGRIVVKEEEPYPCVVCGKPFGARSSVERVAARLAGHWMYAGDNARRLDLVRMCEDCRVTAVVEDGMDPHAATPCPRPRTTEDYLREREQGTDGLDRDGTS